MRQGAGRKDDMPPRRFLAEPLMMGGETHGPPLDREYIDEMLTQYYKERGWSKAEGIPDTKRIEVLAL